MSNTAYKSAIPLQRDRAFSEFLNYPALLAKAQANLGILDAAGTFAGLSGKPTTVSGYGITDALTAVNIGKTLYVDATNGNDSTGTRGKLDKPFLTIAAAISASGIASGDVIKAGPGTFTPSTAIVLPAGVSLVGSGMYATTIASTYSGVGAALVPGSNSVIADLTINNSAGSCVIGAFGGQPAFSGAILKNLVINGMADGMNFDVACSFDAFGCYLTTANDTVIIGNGAGATTLRFHDCVITSDGSLWTGGGGSHASNGPQANDASSLIEIFGGNIRCLNGVITAGYGIKPSNGGTISCYGTKFSVTGTGTPVDVKTTNGGVANIVNGRGTNADGTFVTSGTVNFVSTNALKGANSDITSLSGLTTPLSVAQGGTGITSFGTGVAPALGVNIGSAGALARIVAAPAATGSSGSAGDIAYDASFIYVCTATNTWKRSAISTW